MKIKINKDGKRKLVIKGDDAIDFTLSLIEKGTDPIILRDIKKDFFLKTYTCPRCDEVIGFTDNYCSGCGRPIIKVGEC